MAVRTRFAPSPTGELHLGNARIAVLNWLYARHGRGRFIIRIEDTDVERNVPGAESGILEALERLGLDWDEGPDVGGPHAPYRQSQRAGIYREAAAGLVARERAYPCYCSPEALEERRRAALERGANPVYDGTCRALGKDERRRRQEAGVTPSIRFRVDAGEIVVHDEVRGDVSFPADDFGDFVILKSNGLPTYNFAVVVDDRAMEITHVIRGVGHLSNTPRQVMLYRAFDSVPPRFVHVPHVLAADGSPLSKRQGAITLREYLDAGYHPDAIVNYLSLLSWSSPSGEEVLPPERLIREIDLSRIGASNVTLDPEKLRWLSGEYIRRMTPQALAERLRVWLGARALPANSEERRRVVEALQKRIDTFSEAADLLPQFAPPRPMRWSADAREILRQPGARRVVARLRQVFEELERWEGDRAMEAVRSVGRSLGTRGRELFMPVRAAVTGETGGPELVDIFVVQGRDTVLRVLDEALDEFPPPEQDR